MKPLRFEAVDIFGIKGFYARWGGWGFFILHDMGKWSTSYRQTNPTTDVSASSTKQGPFDTLDEAKDSAEEMRRKLRKLA